MAQATATKQGQKTQGRQGAGRPANYVGHGNYTVNMLSSWRAIEQKLLELGHDQGILDFVYHTTICPKGHKEHLNQVAACKKFFPSMTVGAIRGRATNLVLDFMQQLFVGQHLEEYQAAWDAEHAQPSPTGQKRPRLSIEQKAERLATKKVSNTFRKMKKIGDRGRLNAEMQELHDRYLAEHLPAAIEKATKELEKAAKA